LDDLDRAIPVNTDMLWQAAMLRRAGGRREEAAALLQRLLDSGNRDDIVLEECIATLLELERFDEARRVLRMYAVRGRTPLLLELEQRVLDARLLRESR